MERTSSYVEKPVCLLRVQAGNPIIPHLACKGQHLSSNDHTTHILQETHLIGQGIRVLIFFLKKKKSDQYISRSSNPHLYIFSHRDFALFLFTVLGT